VHAYTTVHEDNRAMREVKYMVVWLSIGYSNRINNLLCSSRPSGSDGVWVGSSRRSVTHATALGQTCDLRCHQDVNRWIHISAYVKLRLAMQVTIG